MLCPICSGGSVRGRQKQRSVGKARGQPLEVLAHAAQKWMVCGLHRKQ